MSHITRRYKKFDECDDLPVYQNEQNRVNAGFIVSEELANKITRATVEVSAIRKLAGSADK